MAASPSRRVSAQMYRVVELVLDESGRLVDHGAVWHPDLDRVRALARTMVRSSMSRRIWIASTTQPRFEQLHDTVPSACLGAAHRCCGASTDCPHRRPA